VVGTVVLVIGELGLYIGAKAAGLHISGEVIAFLLGATVASAAWALWTVGLTMGGGASWAAGGATEEQTGQVLDHLGPDWVVFHNVPFLDGRGPWSRVVDVDHVAVGPSGVLVVETKYTAAELDVSETRRAKQREAIRQVRDNAGRIAALLGRDAPDLPITPLLVWWGPEVTKSGEVIVRANGVLIVRGGDSAEWLRLLTGPSRPQETVRRAVERITRHQLGHSKRGRGAKADLTGTDP
jgi:hypothetical protein